LLAPSEYEGTPTRGYLDAATYGLPPRSTLAAVEEALEGWRTRRRWRDWEEDGEACRELFAGLVGARAEDIAVVTAASVGAGLVAASLAAEPGSNVVL
jgi:kynureninase